MRVRMTQHLQGADHALRPRQEYDLPDAEAQRYIAAGIAIAVADPAAIPASDPAPEPSHPTPGPRKKRTP